MLYGRFTVFCTWVKLLTDLQILGCELHKNAFGGHSSLDPIAGWAGEGKATWEWDEERGSVGKGRTWRGMEGEKEKGEGSDILITETETKTRMICFSFTETKTNTEKILKTETI